MRKIVFQAIPSSSSSHLDLFCYVDGSFKKKTIPRPGNTFFIIHMAPFCMQILQLEWEDHLKCWGWKGSSMRFIML